MTFDETARLAIVAAVMPLWSWLIEKTKTYLSTRRNETGRCLEQRVAYRLGRLWARGYRRCQQALHG